MGHFDKYNNTNCILKLQFESIMLLFCSSLSGFSLRILVAGERFNVTGDYFERGSTSEYKNSRWLPNIFRRIMCSKGEFSNL